MRKIAWMPALVAALIAASCTKEDENYYSVVQTTAPANDPAHHQGESCDSCHTGWNIVQLHDADSPDYNSDCMTCHGDMTDESTLSSSVQGIHPKMCPYVYQAAGQTTMTNEVCVYCHKDTDYLGGSAGDIRRQVAAADCRICHTTAGPGKELYK